MPTTSQSPVLTLLALLALLVIPTFYDIILRWRDAVGRRIRKHPKGSAARH